MSNPFLWSEVEQTLKRVLGGPTPEIPKTLAVGDLSLDRSAFALSSDGGRITLTPTEFRLLEYLTDRPGTVVTAEELPEKVWGFFPRAGDIVRPHLRNLRRKIAQVTRGREVIRTFPRRGCRFSS